MIQYAAAKPKSALAGQLTKLIAGLMILAGGIVLGVVATQWMKAQVSESVTWSLNHESKDIDLVRARQVRDESAALVESLMPMASSHAGRFSLLEESLREVSVQNGLYLEFGVAGGESVNFIAERTPAVIHGFDSFEGLPEDWRGVFRRGYFAMSKLPKVRSNVRLHKGWFNETLPGFMKAHPGPIAFVHMDADLYSSTKTVFDLMAARFVAGTVIQFDEFFNYPGWKEGEYRAFKEFCLERNVKVKYLGYAGADQQVAVKIESIDPPLAASARP